MMKLMCLDSQCREEEENSETWDVIGRKLGNLDKISI